MPKKPDIKEIISNLKQKMKRAEKKEVDKPVPGQIVIKSNSFFDVNKRERDMRQEAINEGVHGKEYLGDNHV